MQKIVIMALCFMLAFGTAVSALDLSNFSVSVTLYPIKLPEKIENRWLANDKEWLSVSVDFTVDLWQGLYFRSNTKTFIFGTNGVNFAPSSTKFISELGYKFKHIKVRYRHFCHHYFHQFENNYSDQDELIFEYSF